VIYTVSDVPGGSVAALSNGNLVIWTYRTGTSDSLAMVGALAGAGGVVVLDQLQGLISFDASGNQGAPSGSSFSSGQTSIVSAALVTPLTLGNWIGPVDGAISELTAVNATFGATSFSRGAGDPQRRKQTHHVPTFLKGPTLGMPTMYNGTQELNCLGNPIPGMTNYFGYSYCVKYTILDQFHAFLPVNFNIYEIVNTTDTNIPPDILNLQSGPGNTLSPGHFTDQLGLGGRGGALDSDAYASVKQIIQLSSKDTMKTLRVNCNQLAVNPPITVNDKTPLLPSGLPDPDGGPTVVCTRTDP
jgi:hypothetical protein